MNQPLSVSIGTLCCRLSRYSTWRINTLIPFERPGKYSSGCTLFAVGSSVVGKKLYVGNLSYDVTNASLETMFSPFGSVKSAEVIQDRDTGRSKGFGFVEMSDDNAALEAIRSLNESDQGGRPLTVNEARPREARSGGFGGSRGGYRR
jgi:RNA recognition motif. (a.k.a. RRM, RBD, or RNP domain)